MGTSLKRPPHFIGENEEWEHYNGGTHNAAAELQKELKEKDGKEGEIYFSTIYGWNVRVRKPQNN